MGGEKNKIINILISEVIPYKLQKYIHRQINFFMSKFQYHDA